MKSVLYIVFLISFSAFSQNEKFFEEANKAYSSADYVNAIKDYEQILKNGEVSAAVYFNLANSFYKLDDLGSSIYYYEKALQLAPNDEDAQINLKIARNATVDDLPDFGDLGISNIIKQSTAALGRNIFAFVAIGSALLFLLFFGFYYFSVSSKRKRLFFSSALFVAIMALVAAGLIFMQNEMLDSNEFAIIFEDEVMVKNEPTSRGGDIFTLHEGTKIRILEDFQKWVEIELADGKQGWVRKEQVKVL